MRIAKRDKISEMQREIDIHICDLMKEAKTPEEVEGVIELLKKRNEMVATRPRLIKPDTIALIAANLLGIGLILSYEKLNVITSKALGFVIRGRV